MDIHEKINQYLSGELSEEENQRFVQELQYNKDLAKKVELERLLHNMEARVDGKVIKDKISRIQYQIDKKRLSLSQLSIAASIILIIGLVSFLKLYDHSNTIIRTDIDKFPPSFTQSLRSSGSQELVFNSDIIRILERKEHKKANRAVQYFSEFQSRDSLVSAQALFNLAQAYQLNRDYNSAEATYRQLLDYGLSDKEMKDQTQYFMALNYILKKERSVGVKALDDIASNTQHLYQNRARNIRSQLNSFWARITRW